jgi:carotenoid cleavage dioxygenase-like enzyme
MLKFPSTGTATGFFQPERSEAAVYDCEMTNRLPADFPDGAFVRVGLDWFYPPMYKYDAAFNADGYISLFRFKAGRVDYKGRWVRTTRWKDDRAADRQLFGVYRNPYTDDPSIRAETLAKPYLRTVANTTPLAWAGRLFALKEDAHPYEVDPKTLETIGPWDFYTQYQSQTFTAHPKLDPVSGELIVWGYEATGLLSDVVIVTVIGRDGHVRSQTRFKVPYVSMIHDAALSQKHVIFPTYGYVTGLERLKEGKVHWGWDPKAPTYWGVLPRDGSGKDIRWFKGPTRAIIHTLNAENRGNKLIVDAAYFDGGPFPFFPPIDGSRWDRSKAKAYFRRLTFDLGSRGDTYTEEILFPEVAVSDLQRIDDRFLTLPYRYGYTQYYDPSRPFDEKRSGNLRGRIVNCYGRFDMRDRKISTYFGGPTCSLEECFFVPRKGGTAEGDGYLIGMASNYAEMRSELVIADAQHLEAGDVARVILPFRASAQVHGKWVDDERTVYGGPLDFG